MEESVVMPSKGQEEPYPATHSFLLNNPVRRLLQPPSKLLDLLEVRPSDTVVDFGCGPGFYTTELARRTKAVVAMDVSPEMLKKAKQKAGEAGVVNVRFVESDGRSLQLEDRSADLVLLVTVYHEIKEHAEALREFGRTIKPGGRLVIVERVKKGLLPGPPVQDPDALKVEVEGSGLFRLQRTLSCGGLGVMIFDRS
jgi:SAM-dependent methyltransferase